MGGNLAGIAVNDEFGFSTSMSSDGNRIASGAPFNNGDGGNNRGSVSLYEFDGSSWELLGTPIVGEDVGDWSGSCVSLSGNGLYVTSGSRRRDSDGGNHAGSVSVYAWNSTELSWEQVGVQILRVSNQDRFGTSCALSFDGSRVAVGAIENDGGATNRGEVRVFDYDGSSWIQVGTDMNGQLNGEQMGTSLAFADDDRRLAVGSERHNGTGVLYVFMITKNILVGKWFGLIA